MNGARLLAAFCIAWSVSGHADGSASAKCPIPGESIQWIADYCMAKIGTDDEIAASDCIAKENETKFRDSCAAKRHFKKMLCKLTIETGTRSGPVDQCVNDPAFMGSTVRNGGVGGRPAEPVPSRR